MAKNLVFRADGDVCPKFYCHFARDARTQEATVWHFFHFLFRQIVTEFSNFWNMMERKNWVSIHDSVLHASCSMSRALAPTRTPADSTPMVPEGPWKTAMDESKLLIQQDTVPVCHLPKLSIRQEYQDSSRRS